MNPLTNVKNLQKINERELQLGLTGQAKSWHSIYKNSAWIYFGGVNFDLTEGDLLCVFSQYGEIVNINLVRDKKTGKSRGFGFVCFEDQRSTILSVDNLNGIKLCNRIIRVDHVENYRPPKDSEEYDELTKLLHEKGCAPEVVSELQQAQAECHGDTADAEEGHADASASVDDKERQEKAERKLLRKEKKRAKKVKKKEKKALKKAKREKKRMKKAKDSDKVKDNGKDKNRDKNKGNDERAKDRRYHKEHPSDDSDLSDEDKDSASSSSSSSSDSEGSAPEGKRIRVDDGARRSPARREHRHSRTDHHVPTSEGERSSSRQRYSDSRTDRHRASYSDRKRSPGPRRRSRSSDRYRRRSRSR